MIDENKQNKFIEVFEAERAPLWRFAYAMTRDREEAKDLVAEAVLKTYESFEKIRDTKALRSYLFTTTSRIYKRKKWRRRLFGDFDAEKAENRYVASETPEINADVQALYWALDKLPFKYKQAIIMFEISGFSIEEISQVQGDTISAVKSRLKRGREKLAKTLSEDKISEEYLFDKAKHDEETNKAEQRLSRTAVSYPIL